MDEIKCFFVSDLHGRHERYTKLFARIRSDRPAWVFMGGDLLPHPRISRYSDFLLEYLVPELTALRDDLGDAYPQIGLILGNDDARCFEPSAIRGDAEGHWHYLHMRSLSWKGYQIFGYSYVPPTPFLLKDWERYDVSRYVDPGCTPPTEGKRTVDIHPDEAEYRTIAQDLIELCGDTPLDQAVMLFHSPPYQSALDRAALDGKMFDHVPLDVHVGSIAIQRFITERQPMLTLHGHIHESSSITGEWKEHHGLTTSMSAAWNGEELALLVFSLDRADQAVRELI